MEQGKLSVKKSKKGKIIVKIFFEGKKGPTELSIHGSAITDTGLDEKEVEFERENGQISKAVCEGKVIYSKGDPVDTPKNIVPKRPFQQNTQQPEIKGPAGSKSVSKPSSENLEMNHVRQIQEKNKAKAPYNFIPLNKKIAEAETVPPFDRYNPDRYTGYIDLRIETKTPLYIRDTLNHEEMKDQEQAEIKKKKYINSDFFSPGGKLKIPGSSLRGMIRTLVEMMSYGRFGEFDDRRLYFRAVADKTSLGVEYKKLMVDENDNFFPKIEAGILERDGNNLSIYPSKNIKNTQFYRINFYISSKKINGPDQFLIKEFDFREVYFNPVEPENHTHQMPNGNLHQLKYALLTSVSLKQDKNHPCRGYLVSSGLFGKKKHMHWVINEPENKPEKIPDKVLREYKLDVTRAEKADLINEMIIKRGKMRVPCFYIRDKNAEISSFGHTGMFRLAYEKSIGEHVPVNNSSILKHTSEYDIPEAIFGNAETFAGRVFFEDASLKDSQNPNEVLMEEKTPKILQTPKPTTFQHYLVQPTDNLKDRRHYNDNSAIRGNKLYWHKSGEKWWIENDSEKLKNEKITTKVKPVKAGTNFSGRIRFENLSKVELGALLFALDLPEGCCHKLGMGKPLGLGSLKIRLELHLSDRKKRYENLFFEWENEVEKNENIFGFKQSFEQYVLNQVGEKADNLWETDRMAELETMLKFKAGLENEIEGKTRYMEIERGEYKSRPILPMPKYV